MTTDKIATRRQYSADLKAQVVTECEAPGASVAKVAMSHGINANIVHGWRKRAREGTDAPAVERREFIPIALAPAPEKPTDDRRIEVELRRGVVTMKITWPLSAASNFASWSRELLR